MLRFETPFHVATAGPVSAGPLPGAAPTHESGGAVGLDLQGHSLQHQGLLSCRARLLFAVATLKAP